MDSNPYMGHPVEVATSPRGAVEIDGRLAAVALGDLQRLTA